MPDDPRGHSIRIESIGLQGVVGISADPQSVVNFAHGSGSSRMSPRNNEVADASARSSDAREGTAPRHVFDIDLLGSRLALATHWVQKNADVARLPINYFGASIGAAAALVAAASEGAVQAIVSRGGRPDLAGRSLYTTAVPTLLIVGSLGAPVIGINDEALARLEGKKTGNGRGSRPSVPGAGSVGTGHPLGVQLVFPTPLAHRRQQRN